MKFAPLLGESVGIRSGTLLQLSPSDENSTSLCSMEFSCGEHGMGCTWWTGLLFKGITVVESLIIASLFVQPLVLLVVGNWWLVVECSEDPWLGAGRAVSVRLGGAWLFGPFINPYDRKYI